MARGDAKRKRENRALRAQAEKKVNSLMLAEICIQPFLLLKLLFKLTGMQSFNFFAASRPCCAA